MQWFYVLVAIVVLTLVAGYICKKRLKRAGRIYVFTAYEPEGEEFAPARVISKYRFYHHLLGKRSFPRVTSVRSLLPFCDNAVEIRHAVFTAREYLWEEGNAVTVHARNPEVTCYLIQNADTYVWDDDITVPRSALICIGKMTKNYILKPGQGFALQDGNRYTFYFYRSQK